MMPWKTRATPAINRSRASSSGSSPPRDASRRSRRRSPTAASACSPRTSGRSTSFSTVTSGSSASSIGSSLTPPPPASAPIPPGGCCWKSPSAGPAVTGRGWKSTSLDFRRFCACLKPRRRKRPLQTPPRSSAVYRWPGSRRRNRRSLGVCARAGKADVDAQLRGQKELGF